MDQIDSFINEIIDTKKLPGMNDDVRAEVIVEMRTSLLDQVNRALIEALPEEKLDEFQRLADDASITDDDLNTFITNSGVDVQKVTVATMLRFRDLYLQSPEDRTRE